MKKLRIRNLEAANLSLLRRIEELETHIARLDRNADGVDDHLNSLGCNPPPKKTSGPSIHDGVVADILKRKAEGLAEYGTLLQAGNGRDSLLDAYEECLDMACYLRQALDEREIKARKGDAS